MEKNPIKPGKQKQANAQDFTDKTRGNGQVPLTSKPDISGYRRVQEFLNRITLRIEPWIYWWDLQENNLRENGWHVIGGSTQSDHLIKLLVNLTL